MYPEMASDAYPEEIVGEWKDTALRCREDKSRDLPGYKLIQWFEYYSRPISFRASTTPSHSSREYLNPGTP